jgi:hypothetical protein
MQLLKYSDIDFVIENHNVFAFDLSYLHGFFYLAESIII